MKQPTPTDIRNQVLKERGITTFTEKGRKSRLKHVPQPAIPNHNKTPLMRYLELVHGEPIERMLLSGSLSVVAKRLDNEVDTSTLSKWIKKLKLRYSESNLPDCNTCARSVPSCESGICDILMEQERYDLVLLKRKEMVDAQTRAEQMGSQVG